FTNTIASAYTNFAADSKDENLLNTARKFANESLIYSKKEEYFEAQVFSFTLLSRSFELAENQKTALVYLDSAINLFNNYDLYNKVERLYEIYIEKSRLYFIENKFNESLAAAILAHQKAFEFQDESSHINATKQLAKCYEKVGDFKNATRFFKKYIALKEAFDKKQKTESINSLELKFNKAKNEQIIRDQQQKNELLNKQAEIDQLNINLLIIGVLVSLLIFGIVFIALRQRALKQKQLLLET
ncbi:MAG: hypothetical protein ACK46Y_04530, partial [Fluviicola sp.]